MSDIAELFTRDPLSLTKDNIDTIISEYRKARANFNLGEKSAGSVKKMTAKAKTVTEIGAPKVKKNLKDLLGDI